ncbi:MAG: divalent-cation tolerance protein CutA [Verrucomicrobiales bacterium]
MIERQNDAENPVLLVVTTFPNPDVARQLGARLVESQLAACVNLIPAVESIYRWRERIENETETVGLLKTTRARLGELEAWLQENHPYEEPEFIAVPVEAGSAGYLGWVRAGASG